MVCSVGWKIGFIIRLIASGQGAKEMDTLRRGMSLREALKILANRGYSVNDRKRHGEFMIRHPSGGKPIIVHNNRKDLPAEVVHLVRRLERGGC